MSEVEEAIVTAVVVLWLIGGIFIGMAAKFKLEDRPEMTVRAEWFGAVFAGLFAPVLIVVLGPRELYRGVRDLYRGFFPKKEPTIPEARVRR